jgi:gentisate 1,2-dioxygenase
MAPALPTFSEAVAEQNVKSQGPEVVKTLCTFPAQGMQAQGTWEDSGRIYEYASAANPVMAPIPVAGMPASEHRSGPSRVISLDVSKEIDVEGYQATTPNLLASFVRVCVGESLTTKSTATSQAFFIIHGSGSTLTAHGDVQWKTGDMFVVPAEDGEGVCVHKCVADDEETGGAGLYWINDAPLLSYLGVKPTAKRFEPAFFSREQLLSTVERIRHEAGAQHRNRMGILLGNVSTPQTKTLSHTLWSLLNVLPAGDSQRPHRHNSVALDLAVKALPGTYTLMGPELDAQGHIINPVRMDWVSGSMFITPPGWWHSHHNESTEDAWVLPMQDAGIYTHQRTLDIRFADEEVARLKDGRIK